MSSCNLVELIVTCGRCLTGAEAAAAAKADAEVQTDPQQLQQQYQLPPDPLAPPAAALDRTSAGLKASGMKLLDPVAMNEQAAAVLSEISNWLPQDVLAAAEAAIAAGSRVPAANAAAGDSAGPDAAYQAAMAAAAAALVGGPLDDVWREEARVVNSIASLAVDLEGSWGNLLQQLEQAQVGWWASRGMFDGWCPYKHMVRFSTRCRRVNVWGF